MGYVVSFANRSHHLYSRISEKLSQMENRSGAANEQINWSASIVQIHRYCIKLCEDLLSRACCSIKPASVISFRMRTSELVPLIQAVYARVKFPVSCST